MTPNEINHYEKVNNLDDACKVLIRELKKQNSFNCIITYEDHYIKVYNKNEEVQQENS